MSSSFLAFMKFFKSFLFCVLVAQNLWGETPSQARLQANLINTIEESQTIETLSQSVFAMLSPSQKQKVEDFLTTYRTFVGILRGGKSWEDLRVELGTRMTSENAPGANITWEFFRNLDKQFKQDLINEILLSFGLPEVYWLSVGTVGYASDIDNVAYSENIKSQVFAKLLHDILNFYMYRSPSGVTFDTEVYTPQAGKILKTSQTLKIPGPKTQYYSLSLSLALLQMYRNSKESDILPWSHFKTYFSRNIPGKDYILKAVETFDREYSQAFLEDYKQLLDARVLEDPKHLKQNVELLFNIKAVTKISLAIFGEYPRFLAKKNLMEKYVSIVSEAKDPAQKAIFADVQSVFHKEIEDISFYIAYLYGLRETFYPEGYLTQAAFQNIVIGNEDYSQLLTRKVEKWIQTTYPSDKDPDVIRHPESYRTTAGLRREITENSPDLFVNANDKTYMISAIEQLAYFIHKLGNLTGPGKKLVSASKYLLRLASSLINACEKYPFLKEALSQEEYQRLQSIHKLAQKLERFKRGFIPAIDTSFIEKELQSLHMPSPQPGREQLLKELGGNLLRIKHLALPKRLKVYEISKLFRKADGDFINMLNVSFSLPNSRTELPEHASQIIVPGNPRLAAVLNSFAEKSMIESSYVGNQIQTFETEFLTENNLEDQNVVKTILGDVTTITLKTLNTMIEAEDPYTMKTLYSKMSVLQHGFDMKNLITFGS